MNGALPQFTTTNMNTITQIEPPSSYIDLVPVAHLLVRDNRFIDVYWNTESKDVIYYFNQRWYMSEDMEIGQSCAFILGTDVESLQADQLLIFEGHGQNQLRYPATKKMYQEFLICQWSDYAISDKGIDEGILRS